MSSNNDAANLRSVALQNAQSILVARRRAEEALREQSDWLEMTLASIGDGVITTDAKGRVTLLNDVAQAVTGWSHDDGKGQLVIDVFPVIHGDTREPIDHPATGALRSGTVIRLAVPSLLISRGGTERPVDGSAAPLRDASGMTVGAVLIFRDVSDRKRTELAHAHLASIVESSEDAIVSKTVEGIVLSWNRSAERMFGYTADEMVGRSITTVIPSERLGEEQEILSRIKRGERIEHFETIRVAKNGRRLHVSLSVSPIRDSSGVIVGASKIARDISKRKQLETRERLLLDLDDAVRALADPSAISQRTAAALGEHLAVNRCAYATVDADEDTFLIVGNYTNGVHSIVGRYTFTQFGTECLRLMRLGEPYVVTDVECDSRLSPDDLEPYRLTAIRAVICVPINKEGRFVAAMAVHSAAPRNWDSNEIDLVQRVASRSWESIERARVSEELRESEHLFRALANSNPNLAWMAHPTGDVYWFNDQWYSYTGTTVDAMSGWGWQAAIAPAAVEAVIASWRRAIQTGAPFEMVFPIRRADGRLRRFLTRANPVRDSRGQIVQWFGTNTDVEAQRRLADANARLRERERAARQQSELQKRVLHSLFMQAPTLIAVLRGPQHTVELANPPVCAMWGRSETELLGCPLADMLPGENDRPFRAVLDDVYQTGTPYVGKETALKLTRRTGVVDTVFLNFVVSPFRNAEGEVEGLFVIASDVTEQVQARNQLSALREIAEDANRAKDEFLAMLGHELRNPLAPIVTALHLMRLRGPDGADREVTVIERQVGHLTRMVDDLLDVSRISRGKIKLREDVVEIAEVVGKAIEMASPLLEQRTHALQVDIPRQGLAIKGDAFRLSQVVANLVTNAAKYTPPAGRISIGAAKEDRTVVLRVRDNGMGISADVLPKVFDLFVQERQAIDRSQGGLGLGLSIVRSLVERHGGTVSAHSEGEQQGSEFVVRLPHAEAIDVEFDIGAPASPPDAPKNSIEGRKVLVVDDSVDAAEMLAAALTEMGHVTRIAFDAPTALDVAARFRPDVALLDIGLPVMDGYELANRLRATPGLGGIVLIAVTGYGQESDRQKTTRAGFDAHLVKPVDFDVIEKMLADARTADAR